MSASRTAAPRSLVGADDHLDVGGADVAGGVGGADRGQVPDLRAQQPRPYAVPAGGAAALPEHVGGEHRARVTDPGLGDHVVAGVDRRQHPEPGGGDLGGEPLPHLTQGPDVLRRQGRVP